VPTGNLLYSRPVLVSEFDFDLPEELIAQEAAPRGQSRLLVMDRSTGAVADSRLADLPELLHSGDLLVVNNTRVFAARLLGRRVPSGGAVECLLLREDRPGLWTALMHPGQKLKPGARVRFEGEAGVIDGEVLDRHFFGRRTVRLEPRGGDLHDLIDALGHIPLPPYIKRPDTVADRERYQTIYAAARGSVAAPTAGLHFTPEILERLQARGVDRAEITLHVGYGTFKPVRADHVEAHVVDPEHYEVRPPAADAIRRTRQRGGRVVAVGTTTTRALEDSAMRGGGEVRAGAADAELFIHPGHEFRVVDGLFTNFHLPKSSLLMLVAAFAGRERVLAAYGEAVRRRYRFYSYGDAMLIL
jgi:S-adenosylmethionine:tRNA ribosyltransferase-isomerase